LQDNYGHVLCQKFCRQTEHYFSSHKINVHDNKNKKLLSQQHIFKHCTMNIDRLHVEAIANNNRGASLLEEGKYGDAVVVLSNAQKFARRGLEKCRQVVGSAPPANRGVSFCESLDRLMIRKANPQSSDEEYGDSHNDGFVYRQPIQIPPSSLSIDCQSSLLVSVAIIFNLALAHHLCGMEYKEVGVIRKALRLYECSYKLYRSYCQIQEISLSSSSLLPMAAMNNSGQIHRLLGEDENARCFFQSLFSSLIYIGYCREGRNRGLDLEGFFQTTSQWIVLSCNSYSMTAGAA
jgi:hypothetical protein